MIRTKRFFTITCVLVFISNFLIAQHEYENETMDDPYIQVPESEKQKSPAYKFSNSLIFTTQVNIDENGDDILGDAANETSLAIDPTNPLRMVIGWRQFETIESNFRQAGIAYTEDGGITWINLDPIEAEFFRSDPVIDTDSDGNFYYNSLNTDYQCHVFKTNDLEDWSDKTYAIGGDKQWMVIDKTDQISNGQIYAFWKAQFSDCDGNFTRSTDEGLSYEECELVTSNPTRGTLAIDAEGDLYACGGWNNTFKVLKSTTAKDPNEVVTWEQNVTVDMGGPTAIYDGPNPSGMLGQVWVATDHSATENYGNVYLLAPVERDDNNDPSDIMFSRSTDGGLTWSDAVPINDDSSNDNWQWFGSISVAPNGRIDVTWVDTRDNPGTVLSALYYSYSVDGGLTWSPNENLSESFDPHIGWPNQEKMGDYYQMISTNEGAHLAWCGTFNGGQDVFYSFITPDEVIGINENDGDYFDLVIHPNPVKDDLNIVLNIKEPGEIQFSLTDVLGKEKILTTKTIRSSGRASLAFDSNELQGFSPGLYILNVTDRARNSQSKTLIIK